MAQALPWKGTVDDLRTMMREAGIMQTVISTAPLTQTGPRKDSDHTAANHLREQQEPATGKRRDHWLREMDSNNLWGCEIGRAHPEFLPFINVDPILMDAVSIRQRVREAVSRGARGIILLPGQHGFYGNDRRAWPIYEMAQSFKLPILAQTGDAGPLPAGGRGHWGRPRYFGDVAIAFPRLQLILGHLGKGYESEIAVLTRRYRNVYTETSARLTGLDEVGRWTPAEAVTWFRLIGIDRILLGTQWPLFDPRQVIETLRKLSLTPEEKRKILGENAKRVLQL
jgi:predicted TIM-barrel fold metal-dependent hydrolase